MGISIFNNYRQAKYTDEKVHSLLFLVSGKLKWYEPECEGTLHKGEILVMPAGIKLSRTFLTRRAEQLWFALPDNNRWRQLHSEHAYSVPSQHIEELHWLTEKLLKRQQNNCFSQKNDIGDNLISLLRSYFDAEMTKITGRTRPEEKRINFIIQKVSEQPSKNWSINHLADLIGLTPAGLHALIKRVEGTTPMKLVTRIRLNKAKNLLRDSNLGIEEIAYATGYGSPYAFSNTFLRLTGIRPGKYRKEYATAI